MIDMEYFWKLEKARKEEQAKLKREKEDRYKAELEAKGIKMIGYSGDPPKTEEEKRKEFYGYCEHPNTPDNGAATFMWLVAMGVSIIFKGGWALCILETIVWWKFITRHNGK